MMAGHGGCPALVDEAARYVIGGVVGVVQSCGVSDVAGDEVIVVGGAAGVLTNSPPA